MDNLPDSIRLIMPRAPFASVVAMAYAMDTWKMDAPPVAAAFLAQVAVESLELTALQEDLDYSAAALLRVFPTHFTAEEADTYAHQPERIANRVYANRNGNGDEASGDGWQFRGRGDIGVTFYDNYRACGAGIRQPLEANPDLLLVPEHAASAACWFWTTRGLSDLAYAENFEEITHRINGGLEDYPQRLGYYATAKKVFGLS